MLCAHRNRGYGDSMESPAPALIRRHSGGSNGFGGRSGAFAHLEPNIAANGNILAQFVDHLTDEFSYSHRLILNEVLFVEAIFFVELFHLAIDDFFDDRLGRSGRARLRLIDLAFAVKNFLRDLLAPDIAGVERGD